MDTGAAGVKDPNANAPAGDVTQSDKDKPSGERQQSKETAGNTSDGGDEDESEEEGDEEDSEADSEEEEDDDDEEDDDEEDDEDEEPRFKYSRLTEDLGSCYRNGDATSSFLVAGDKMVCNAQDH
jgi:hypothetical protein